MNRLEKYTWVRILLYVNYIRPYFWETTEKNSYIEYLALEIKPCFQIGIFGLSKNPELRGVSV
jgi:hypothetical protein